MSKITAMEKHVMTIGIPRLRMAVVTVAVIMLTTPQAHAAKPESAAKPELLAQAVAVKNVCAWPNLTPLADGAVVATIFNQPCHGRWEGDVDCWATVDGGKTWQLRGTPAPHEPPAAVLPIWVCRSADGGRTWSHADGVELPTKSRLAATAKLTLSDRLVPFGDIIEIGESRLGVCLYAFDPATKTHAAYFFTSADDGATWSIAGIIDPEGLTETTPLRLADGDLLACARTHWDEQANKEQRLELFRSTDNGATWRRERPVTAPSEHPAHLLQLADGRILLTYGDRNEPKGIEVRVSGDGGRTWSPPERIAGFDGDGGYPSTVELADGRLLTAYYASRTALHDGYQMATVTWRLPPKP